MDILYSHLHCDIIDVFGRYNCALDDSSDLYFSIWWSSMWLTWRVTWNNWVGLFVLFKRVKFFLMKFKYLYDYNIFFNLISQCCHTFTRVSFQKITKTCLRFFLKVWCLSYQGSSSTIPNTVTTLVESI